MLRKGRKYSWISPFIPAGTKTKMGSIPGREQSSTQVLETLHKGVVGKQFVCSFFNSDCLRFLDRAVAFMKSVFYM